MKRRDILISAGIIVVALSCTVVLSAGKGNVVFTTPGAQLQLKFSLIRTLTLTSSPQPIAVSARTYTPRALVITAKQDDQTWQMTSRNPWSQIEVKAGATTEIKCGPPFKIVPQVLVGGGQASLGFAILGQGGERYSNVIAKDGKVVPAPGFKILDEKGKVLTSGQFEYG
jgi:hypothetical protein